MSTLRSFSLVLLSLIATSVLAQSPRYIELAVSDTILLAPTAITYEVSTGDGEGFRHMRMPSFDEEADTVPTVSLDDTMAKLKAAKFNATWQEEDGYKLEKDERGERKIQIVVTDRKEMDRLLALLRPIQGISGSIQAVEHESPEKYH
ncbi:MAG TPA: hypothetical protein VHL57_11765, partial [Flavobacteriales bacterium]|nr:hypothetical protein [Flavobacteriales bacterium]